MSAYNLPPIVKPISPKDIDRFFSKVEITDSCWIWKASVLGFGYGQFIFERKLWLAHRFSFELFREPLTAETCVLHKCDVPRCVNPAHLFTGTRADNAYDMFSKGRGISGERVGSAKLRREEVMEIRESAVPYKKLAAKFGVSKSHIKALRSSTCRLWRNAG